MKELILKNLIAFAQTMVPSGSVMEFKAKLLAMAEARAAATKNPMDDKAVALLKSEEADALVYCVLCCVGCAAKDAAKKTETEIDDSIAELFIKAIGVNPEDCENH